ncbi:MAG: hypothetical protein NTZ16_12695 [Verrucomicrobia bacterium]|nr:hypothetical protein [Verrucomicrobiota bacterium]
MEIIAYDSTVAAPKPVILGSPIVEIWTSGFRGSQERNIQVAAAMRAPVPTLFDRLTRTEDFGFAAQRTFSGATAQQEALKFFRTHPNDVPALAHLQFIEDGQSAWLRDCGIKNIALVKKTGVTVGFSYTIIGGTASLT